jgi:hypothetical protein
MRGNHLMAVTFLYAMCTFVIGVIIGDMNAEKK